MAERSRGTTFTDTPAAVVERVRTICVALPDVTEQPAWTGSPRWQVRRRTFAHVYTLDGGAGGPTTMVTFRAEGEDLDVLRAAGHPFFLLGWGRDALGMVLDAATDWDEVREVLTDSYCTMAPMKLAARVDRPDPDGPATND